ncbi:MAG TPA: STAS domain-containing protein [Ignavibacteriaceae bacterium]|nr:STAS domain-containing protein [Ignavibacteriaceae bacterium]
MAEFNTFIKNEGDINLIYLNGYLDAHTAPKLETDFSDLLENKNFKIVVNFKDLAYISSAGLGVFMAFIEKIRERNGDIKLTAMNEKVYNIFDLLGFPLLYEIFKSDEEAINKFKEMNNLKNDKK